MSVMVCPECGAEYLASVAVCADDGTLLVESDNEEMEAEISDEVAHADDLDAAGIDSPEVRDQPTGEQVAYDLGDWDVESRIVLARLLTGEDVMHVWEAATLVVRAEDEERVDELVDQVEETTQPLLDPDRDQVGYELEGWPQEKRDALAESLGTADIPFGFDENGDLVVHEEDEDKVEPVLDQIDLNFSLDADAIAARGDEEDGVDDADPSEDGLEAQDVLSDLFIAADKLMHDAKHKDGVLGMVEGAKAIAGLALPYGFASGVWNNIRTRASEINAMIEGDDADDEAIESAARELREVLRQYV